MRIATKIISGYAILIALMAAVLVYQVASIHHMQSINKNLSGLNFSAARTSIQLMRDRDLVEEYTKKSFIVGDPDYVDKLREFKEGFASSLQDMQYLGRSEREQVEINRLVQFWEEFSQALARELAVLTPGTMPSELDQHLERLRAQVQTVHQVSLRTIEAEVGKAADTGAKAEWISWSAAAIALVVSFLVSFFIVRSISEPLHHLTEGTRAVAEGKFYYRLDASRNDEFALLAKDFNTMTARLNELDQMKKDFVSHVSHELKGPLASMQETTHMLLEEIPGSLTEKQKRLLDLNLLSSKRLSSMLENLLDMSRLEAGVMEYELTTQELVVLIQTVVSQLEPQALEKTIRVEPDLPAKPLIVECDGDRIIQVLSNLLGNAIKFSPPGSVIKVRAFSVAALPETMPASWREKVTEDGDSAGFALVAVSDSGPGVPDAHKEKIFEKFHQVKQGKKISGQGVGLGLAICRTIMEAHRGAIWVEDNSNHGSGSVFWLLLRLGSSQEGVTHRTSSPL